MSDRPASTTRSESRVRNRLRSRGLWGRTFALLLQPKIFFESLPSLYDSLDWFWIGILVLAVLVFGATRLSGLSQSVELSSGNASDAWTFGITAISKFILMWLVHSILLVVSTRLSRAKPSWGLSLKIAVWASVPLALMVILQVVYLNNVGVRGEPGLTGLLEEMQIYETSSPLLQRILVTIASHFTLFTLWNLILLGMGARYSLNAKAWAFPLVVIVWIVVSTVVPAIAV